LHQHSWEYLWSEALRPGLVAQRQVISVCFAASAWSCHCPWHSCYGKYETFDYQ